MREGPKWVWCEVAKNTGVGAWRQTMEHFEKSPAPCFAGITKPGDWATAKTDASWRRLRCAVVGSSEGK